MSTNITNLIKVGLFQSLKYWNERLQTWHHNRVRRDYFSMSCESTKCIALTDLASHLVLNYNVDCVFFRIVGNLNFFLWFCSMTSVSQSSMLFLLKNTVSRFTPRQLLLESLLHCTKNITFWNPKLAQSRLHCRFPMGNFSMIAVIINIPFISLHFHILSSSPN